MIMTMRLSLFAGTLGIMFLLFPSVTLAGCDQETSLRVTRILHQVYPDLEAGRDRQVLTTLEGFINQYPQEKHYLLDYYRGNLYASLQQPLDALAAYTGALELCTNNAALWQNHGAVAWDLKRYDVAAESLLRAYTLQRDDDLFFNATVALLYAGRIQQAVGQFEELIERRADQTPDQWLETYSGLAFSHDMVARSVQKLEQWKPLFVDRSLYWRLLSMTYLQQKNYQKAVATLKVHVSFAEPAPEDKRLLADLLLQVELPLQAAPLYEDLLRDRPDDIQLYQQLILSYRLGHKPEEALSAIDRALKIKQDRQLVRSRAEVSFYLGKYAEAFDSFAQLAKEEPDNGRALLYQGYSALRMGRKDLARQVLTRAARFSAERNQASSLLAYLDAAGQEVVLYQ